MMGYQLDFQPKLFYHSMNLDERIPANSILRKIRGQIDFDFIYHEVKDRYGEKGNVCNKCRRYIKTVELPKSSEEPNLDVEDIATLHLDMIAYDEGYN